MKICVDAREFISGRKTGIGRYLETFLTSYRNTPWPEDIPWPKPETQD